MISYSLSGKVALITGSSRGIGYAIGRRLAQAGCDVALVSRNDTDVKAAAETLLPLGVRSVGLAADMRITAEAQAVPRTVVDLLGRLDILVNSAGVSIRTPALEVTEDLWDKTLDTNLKGMFFCSQSAASHMVTRGAGSIVNIGSVQSFVAQRNQAPYDASKGGVVMLTKVLAVEWAQYGIRVNCVAPGSIRTEINKEYLSRPENLQKNLSMIPLGRIGDPEDVAGVVAFLCTEDAAYVTGATVLVDGGWTLE